MLKKIGLMAMLAVAATGWGAPLPAKIHGHVQDPLSQPVANDKVLLSATGTDVAYTFTTDTNGDYKGDGITAGKYTIFLQKAGATKADAAKATGGVPEGVIDMQPNVNLVAGQDTQVDFDLSRKDYIAKLPPDVQKQIAEARAKNADVIKQNSQIQNVNKLLEQARKARAAGNFDQAIALDQAVTQAKPDAGLGWSELAISQMGAKKCADAIPNFKKAIDLYQADKKPKPELIAGSNNDLGECYAQSGKPDLALAAYEAAVKAQPDNAAMFYRNEAVTLLEAGQNDAATQAADKAIAADPRNPKPYYVKGQSLLSKATADPRHPDRVILPPDCIAAYQKFLSLAPNDQLAPDVRSILQSAGVKAH